MEYSTSFIELNGVWREILIVPASETQTFGDQFIFTQPFEDGNTFGEIIYYTEGLYKEIEENGKFYYWFLLRSKETRATTNYEADVKELQAQIAALAGSEV